MKIQTHDGYDATLVSPPDQCPFCHRKITPIPLRGYTKDQRMQAFLLCPSSQCNSTFIAHFFRYGQSWNFDGKTSAGNLKEKEFSEKIEEISKSFTIIYNQSSFAEQNGLLEICGVGYRKALEFLIKDYSIANHPDQKDVVEKATLGNCIESYVTDDRIKGVAKRAVWLGNDETHYVRKWEGKNLEDLKKLIELTVHWIEMEALTKSFYEDMPG